MPGASLKGSFEVLLKTSLILLAGLTLFLLMGSGFQWLTDLSPISEAKNAWLLEPLSLLITWMVLTVLTLRPGLSWLILAALYGMLMLFNAEMYRVFGLVFSLTDLKHAAQVLLVADVWADYWPQFLLMIGLLSLMLLGWFKTQPHAKLHHYRWPLRVWMMVALLLLITHRQTVTHQLNRTLYIEGRAQPVVMYEWNGFLFSTYYTALVRRSMQMPDGYDQARIEGLLSRRPADASSAVSRRPDVIIFFIEAFADPQSVQIQTNQDPIQHFRHRAAEGVAGMVISPEQGGRSANPEFELLTGLSMRFMPDKAIPYMDQLDQPTPSLAREFKRQGYTTTALHVASLDFFNYKKVYPLLGFDHIRTLWQQPGVAMDPAGRYPSEMALVETIIATTEAHDEPQFIFSFPNATHGFWTYDAYDDGVIAVQGNYAKDDAEVLKTYLNALHAADQAIEHLISHYQQSDQPAVILVLGDHQPGLPVFRQQLAIDYLQRIDRTKDLSTGPLLRKFFRRKFKRGDPHEPAFQEMYRKSHQVPYLLWRNFDPDPQVVDSSMFLLGSQLLAAAQVESSSLYQLLSDINAIKPPIHKRTVLTEPGRSLMTELELLQYDIMAGERYFMSSNPELLYPDG
ncbi:LTA synthase family protein [Marinicella meishanensis]|uniref:LTA synthase family protein n=1 Tax=Marinicella meishanensis TaxID=2873263 RepID=UPI001CBBA1F9|nr:LTA synthase family protein [Marinicella sp. NBU2979]